MSRTVSIEFLGESPSFPGGVAPFSDVEAGRAGEVLILAGQNAGTALTAVDITDKVVVLIELDTECLGVYTGESKGLEGSRVLGFARFRLGTADPTNLVELVRQPKSDPNALTAAKEVFESAGFKVAVCNDLPGRIVNRLARPVYNAVLRRLDEGLATAEDMDTTLRMGLGYPEGLIALLERTGLAEHYDATRPLYDALGDPAYAPARRAQVAKLRRDQGKL